MEWTIQGECAYTYTGGKPLNAELPRIVSMHNAQNDHPVWGLQTHWLTHHGFSVLTVGLLGYGCSDGAPLETVKTIADWVTALIHAAGVTQPVTVASHSMGSLITLECASRYADRVRRIVPVTTAWSMKVSDALLDAALNNAASAIEMVNMWSHSSLANKPSPLGPDFWMHSGSQRLMERVARGTGASVFHTDFAACNAYTRNAGAVASVKCPSLVIVGEKDQMTPAKAGRYVAAGLADNRVVGLPGGHAITGECPDGTFDALIAFARGRGVAAAQDASQRRIMATADSHSSSSFAEFYPYYLSGHQDHTCQRLHFAGSTVALACLVLLVLTGNPRWLLRTAVSGYTFAWIGHSGFEKNRPVTFWHPFYNLMGDWAMHRDIWTGKIPF